MERVCNLIVTEWLLKVLLLAMLVLNMRREGGFYNNVEERWLDVYKGNTYCDICLRKGL